jgi:hypothetical protein
LCACTNCLFGIFRRNSLAGSAALPATGGAAPGLMGAAYSGMRVWF